jgi:hypothetical protein
MVSTNDAMLAALKDAEPVLADLDALLKKRHPGFTGLSELVTVRAAIARGIAMQIAEMRAKLGEEYRVGFDGPPAD